MINLPASAIAINTRWSSIHISGTPHGEPQPIFACVIPHGFRQSYIQGKHHAASSGLLGYDGDYWCLHALHLHPLVEGILERMD